MNSERDHSIYYMLEIVIEARSASLGAGMNVKRILPFRKRRMVGPFIFMDHAGPLEVQQPISSMDVLPHPHIGLSTVSYLFDGQVTHRDSLGVKQVIQPGEVNWMTAGKGIAHSERFEDPASLTGGFEMIQTWVALPERDEEAEPSFNNYKKEHLPIFTDTGIWMRLIAGNAFGLMNKVETHSPLFYIHVVLNPQAKLSLPHGYDERGIYIVKGALEVAGRTYSSGQMLVFSRGSDPVVISKGITKLMLLGGEPLGERFIWWNFVSSRRGRIEQAKADWKEGRINLPPNDNTDFVPLPEEKYKVNENPQPGALS